MKVKYEYKPEEEEEKKNFNEAWRKRISPCAYTAQYTCKTEFYAGTLLSIFWKIDIPVLKNRNTKFSPGRALKNDANSGGAAHISYEKLSLWGNKKKKRKKETFGRLKHSS